MRLRGIFTAFSAMLLLAGMFMAVHRGTRGRQTEGQVKLLNDRLESADARLAELDQEIVYLSSRPRIERAATELGMHVPEGDELVYLFIGGVPTASGDSP